MIWQIVTRTFTKPEACSNPYVWGAIFATHMAISLVVWIALINLIGSPYEATKWAIYAYFFWQAAQFAMQPTKLMFLDCVLDLAAWSSVCFALFELWLNLPLNALGYIIGAFLMLMVGIVKRCNNV